MPDEPHKVDPPRAKDPGDRGVLGSVLQEPGERGRLFPNLAKQNGIGDVWSRSRLGHRLVHHFPPLGGMNTGVEPDRSRRLSSETSR